MPEGEPSSRFERHGFGSEAAPELWPYRSKPRADESLSSWVARLAIGNGRRLHSFCSLIWPDRQIWNRDVDGLSDAELIDTIADNTATPIERARKTAIASFAGSLFAEHNPTGTTRWVLRAGVYHRVRRAFGQQFCPRCLSEDEPYYRLSWRLAWMTVCPVHGTLLLDRCPKCRSPVMFHRPAMQMEPISLCGSCGFDLRHAPIWGVVDTAAVGFQKANAEILERGWAQLGPYMLPYSCTYFDAVHQLARILSAGPRSAALRTEVAKRWGGDPEPPTPSGNHVEMERLDVLSRHRTLGLAARLVSEWPNRFVEACRRAEVWQSWALKDADHPPFALWEPVHLQVNKSSYIPTRGEVAAARRYLVRRGKKPGQHALRQLLGLDSELFANPRRIRSVGALIGHRRSA